MTSHNSIEDLVARVQAGDESAIFELDQKLRSVLLRIVQAQRASRYQSQIDSEGIVNVTLRSFLSEVQKGAFDGERSLALLRAMVRHKLLDALKEVQAAKRGDGRVDRQGPRQMAAMSDSRATDPAESAAQAELELLFLEKLPEIVRGAHKNSTVILEKTIEGMTTSEIATDLNMSVRNVQMIRQRMVEACEAWLEVHRSI